MIAGATGYVVMLIADIPFTARWLCLSVCLTDPADRRDDRRSRDWHRHGVRWLSGCDDQLGVWAIVYQQVENNISQPRIQPWAVGMGPFIALVAVLFRATLFGVMGGLTPVPTAA